MDLWFRISKVCSLDRLMKRQGKEGHLFKPLHTLVKYSALVSGDSEPDSLEMRGFDGTVTLR